MAKFEVYQLEKDVRYATGLSLYAEGDKVETGKVVHVTHMSGMFDNILTTEYVTLGYWNGHAYVAVKKDKPAVVGDPIHWTGDIWLREEQFLYLYCPDVAVGEVMRLRAHGYYEQE